MSQNKPDYRAFNRFQNDFFTNRTAFQRYTDYEINRHSFMLFQNITKIFPTQAVRFMFYNDFLKFNKNPSIIRALQTKYVNGFTRARLPKEIFYKQGKKIKPTKQQKKKINKDLIDFDVEIVADICRILMYDSKTYQRLKYTSKVQKLGKELTQKWNEQLQN